MTYEEALHIWARRKMANGGTMTHCTVCKQPWTIGDVAIEADYDSSGCETCGGDASLAVRILYKCEVDDDRWKVHYPGDREGSLSLLAVIQDLVAISDGH